MATAKMHPWVYESAGMNHAGVFSRIRGLYGVWSRIRQSLEC